MTCSTATLRLGAGAMIVAPSNLATPAKSAHIQSPSALSSTPFGASAIQRDAGTLEVVTADTAAHASLSPFAMVASPFSAAALAEEQTQAELHATSSLQHAKRGHSAPALQHSARLHGRSIRFVRCLGQGSLGHEVSHARACNRIMHDQWSSICCACSTYMHDTRCTIAYARMTTTSACKPAALPHTTSDALYLLQSNRLRQSTNTRICFCPDVTVHRCTSGRCTMGSRLPSRLPHPWHSRPPPPSPLPPLLTHPQCLTPPRTCTAATS